MPVIHVGINRIPYVVCYLQFVIQILYVVQVTQFCTGLVSINVDESCMRDMCQFLFERSMNVPGISSLQVQQMEGGMGGRFFPH